MKAIKIESNMRRFVERGQKLFSWLGRAFFSMACKVGCCAHATMLWLKMIVVSSAVCVLSESAFSSGQRHSEADMRAAVIVGVLRFSSWENTEKNQGALHLCLAGAPPSSEGLMGWEEKVKIRGRKLVVEKVSRGVENLSHCDVVVFGKKLSRNASRLMLERALSEPMLSVCDNCLPVIENDALIRLHFVENLVTFSADWRTAKELGIRFDSSLLELMKRAGGR